MSDVKSYSDIEILHEMILSLVTRLHELEKWTRCDEDAIYSRIKNLENKLNGE